jgi:hypothetical protein
MFAAISAVAMPAAGAASPELLLSVRGLEDGRLERDLPLFVSLYIEASGVKNATLVLAPKKGNWSDAVQVELLSATPGTPPILARKLTGSEDDPAMTLDAERAVEGVWFFPSSELTKLTPGDYRVQAKLVMAEGGGWKGTALSESVAVKIIAATVNDNDARDRAGRRVLALANEAIAMAQFSTAARLIDERLEVDPEQIEFLKLRAVLCLHGGNPAGANACVNRAWDRVMREQWTHPPRDLYLLTQTVTSALLQTPRDAAQGNPPAWSIPSDKVRAPILPEKTILPSAARPAASTVPAVVVSTPTPTLTATTSRPAEPAATKPAVATRPSAATNSPPVSKPTKPGAPAAGVLIAAAELSEEKILAEPLGHWAAEAVAGSQYDVRSYTAVEATGAPDVPKAGDSPKAWCHHGTSKETDWLELSFATPVRATEIRVRQTLNPGTIVKLEAIEPDGTSHTWWAGRDETGLSLSAGTIAWFAVRVPKADYVVARVKVTLDLRFRLGWKQIDAVQLVGTP